MNISSRCEYAVRAMIELARYEDTSNPLTAVTIAERRHIPEKYLVHIPVSYTHLTLPTN